MNCGRSSLLSRHTLRSKGTGAPRGMTGESTFAGGTQNRPPSSNGASRMLSLAERWLALRNRLVSSPRFQKFAATTPGVRTIARNKARGVFDLLSGFIYSQFCSPACASTSSVFWKRRPYRSRRSRPAQIFRSIPQQPPARRRRLARSHVPLIRRPLRSWHERRRHPRQSGHRSDG